MKDQMFCEVDFDDGSFSDNMYPEDIEVHVYALPCLHYFMVWWWRVTGPMEVSVNSRTLPVMARTADTCSIVTTLEASQFLLAESQHLWRWCSKQGNCHRSALAWWQAVWWHLQRNKLCHYVLGASLAHWTPADEMDLFYERRQGSSLKMILLIVIDWVSRWVWADSETGRCLGAGGGPAKESPNKAGKILICKILLWWTGQMPANQ